MNIKKFKKALAFITVIAIAVGILLPSTLVKAEESNTLVTITARNTDDNQRISSAKFNIKDPSGKTLAFTKSQNGIYVYSDMGNTQTVEADAKGKAQVSNLPPGSYIVSDYEIPSTFISKGNSTFTLGGPSEQLEVSMDYILNVGSLTVSYLDGDTNKGIAKGRFVLKDSNGNLVNVTNVNNKGNYECSNSKSGAGEFLTNKQGKATVSNIPAGQYILEQVYAPFQYNSGLETKRVTITAKDTALATITNVGRYGDLTVKVTSSMTSKKLSGFVFKVVNSEGYAIPLYEQEDNVYYYNDGGKDTEVTVKSASKDLDIIGLPAGNYTLHMVKGITNYKKIGDVRFSINNRRNTTLSVKSPRAVGNITIIKKDKSNQKALEGFKMRIYDKEGKNAYKFKKNEQNKYEYVSDDTEDASADLVTDKDGKISAKGLPTGTVMIKEVAAPEGYMFSRAGVEQTIAAKTETVYESESDKSNCVLEFIDEQNKGVKGVSVRIIDLNGKIVLESKSNANGYVLMSNIAEGTYTYEVTEVPSTYSLPETKAEFTISKDGIATGLSPIKVEFSKLTVSANGMTEEDKSGIEFTLTNAEGANFTATTGADGKAVFVQVPYGVYSLKQTSAKDGYTISEDIIDNIVVDGKYKSQSFDFSLTPADSQPETTPGIKTQTESEIVKKSNALMTVLIILVVILMITIGGIIFVIFRVKADTKNGQTKTPQQEPGNRQMFPSRTEQPPATKNTSSKKQKKKANNNKTKEKAPEPIKADNKKEQKKNNQNENLVVPENVNDRKPKKNSAPIDPFTDK